MSFKPIILECLKNRSSFISRHKFFAFNSVEKGLEIFLIATFSFVLLFTALHTTPYAPCPVLSRYFLTFLENQKTIEPLT